MALTVIHVNQHTIKRNTRQGSNEPCVTFKRKSGGKAGKWPASSIARTNPFPVEHAAGWKPASA